MQPIFFHRCFHILICLTFFLVGCDGSDYAARHASEDTHLSEMSDVQLPPENDDQVSLSQGVWGNVWFWSGNHMPTIEPEDISGTIEPVEREIYIHEVASLDAVTIAEGKGLPFYEKINTPLVKVVMSNAAGLYQAELPTGEYSLFVKEGDLFYANQFDTQGNINTVAVVENQMTKCQVDITYAATF